eukprot:14043129-Heterocapsa_arctica.AAC.1
MAEVIQGQGGGDVRGLPKGPGTPTGPPGKAALDTPQGAAPGTPGQRPTTPKAEGAGFPSPVAKAPPL